MNFDRRLIVDDSGKRQTVAQRNCRVAFDDFCKQPTASFESQTKRQHIEQDDIFHVTTQNAALNCSSHVDNFIRVNLGGCFFAKYLGHRALNDRRARLTADQNHLVDIARLQLRVG